MRAALFPRALGDVDVPAAEVLAALLLRMCCGETEKRSLTATAHGNATLPKLAGDDAALRDDVAAERRAARPHAAAADAARRRRRRVGPAGDASGARRRVRVRQRRRRAPAALVADAARRRRQRPLGPDAGADARRAVARRRRADSADRARRPRHALAEGLLTLAANSLTTAPGAAFVWLETLARTHVASAAGLAEEVAHVRLLAAALVASHMRKEGRLENLLALLLERAFAHASAAARRMYASAATPRRRRRRRRRRVAAASPFALWQHTGLLRLLEGATQSLAQAGASRACTELCHALAHAAMSARRCARWRTFTRLRRRDARAAAALRRRARDVAAVSGALPRRQVRRSGAVAALPGGDFVYRQALAGFSTTEQVAGGCSRASSPSAAPAARRSRRWSTSCRRRTTASSCSSSSSRSFRCFDAPPTAAPGATDCGIVLRGEATTVFVRWRHAFPGPLARSRVIATAHDGRRRRRCRNVAAPLTDAERAPTAKDPRASFAGPRRRSGRGRVHRQTRSSQQQRSKRRGATQQQGRRRRHCAAVLCRAARRLRRCTSAFQILRKRVQTALAQAKLNS
jgi:hypothetical protein